MNGTNLFQELKDVLQEFKDFLDENVATIRPAINALAGLIPQINDLLNLLIGLMNSLRTEIENLDVSGIPGLEEVSNFTMRIRAFLEAARNLLPEEAGTIDEVLAVADVVTSLPSLDEVRAEILALITAITGHLESLRAS
jgi:ABC-type transporter Mla subunit MlaD